MAKTLAVLLPVVLLIALPLSPAEVRGKGDGEKAAPPPKPVVTSSKVPDDVEIPDGFMDNPIAFFDDYSWKAFIAVVWPGLKDKQGVPDTDPKQTVDGFGPRVFETYNSLAEVFHPDGSAPADLDEYDPPKYNPCGVKTAYGDVTLGSFSKFSNLGQAGFGTKIHLVTDGNGLPLAVEVSSGQRHESLYAGPVLEAVRIRRGNGRIRTRPRAVAGDKGYSYARVRSYLRRRKITAVIPTRKDQRRRPGFDKEAYRRRNVVERCINWLKECRAVATRFDKLAVNYLSTVKLAMLQRYLPLLAPVDSSDRP